VQLQLIVVGFHGFRKIPAAPSSPVFMGGLQILKKNEKKIAVSFQKESGDLFS